MVWPTWLPIREDLQAFTPYGAPQILADATLNTNENPYSPSPELIQAISDAVFTVASTLNRYPDREATALREVLADYINGQNSTNISMENIWVANGSNEIIQSLFLAFGDKGALGFTPSYSMHPLIAKVSRTQWVDGSRNTDFSLNVDMAVEAILEHKPSLTFITTPNNPTGSAVKITDIEKLADAVKAVGGLLAVDEAYAEFSAEGSAATLVKSNPHVVVIRTMSKAFAFAGARVGYLVGDKCIVEAMLLVRLPYHLSALTQAAAQVALEFKDELLGYVSTLIDAREALVLELENLGLACIESSANFILFTGFRGPGPKLWRELLDKGVLIRDVGLEGYLRVTIGNEAENKLFITALRDLV